MRTGISYADSEPETHVQAYCLLARYLENEERNVSYLLRKTVWTGSWIITAYLQQGGSKPATSCMRCLDYLSPWKPSDTLYHHGHIVCTV